MWKNKTKSFLRASAIFVSLAVPAASYAQATPKSPGRSLPATQDITMPDLQSTIVNYLERERVTVDLRKLRPTIGCPKCTEPGGTAAIERLGNTTLITLNLLNPYLSSPGEASTLNVYAVEPTGKVTLIGKVSASQPRTEVFTTPLDRFALVVSPEANLQSFMTNQGITLLGVPKRGKRSPASRTLWSNSLYSFPMLGIPSIVRNKEVLVEILLTGDLLGARVSVLVERRNDAWTSIKAHFREFKQAPVGKAYVLWAVSPDHKFVRLGQIANPSALGGDGIRSETALTDFGLLITLEDARNVPAGPVVGMVLPKN